MGSTFSQHVKLFFEVFLIKLIRVCSLWRITIAIGRYQHNEGCNMIGSREAAAGPRRVESLGGSRHPNTLNPSDSEISSNCFFESWRSFLIRLEEQITHRILTSWRELDIRLAFEVLDEGIYGELRSLHLHHLRLAHRIPQHPDGSCYKVNFVLKVGNY